MKRLLAAALAALMLLSLAACGQNGGPRATQAPYEKEFEIGMLYFSGFYLRHKINALKLSGNRAGSAINEKEPAGEGIRAVFELGEEISYLFGFSEPESGECTVCICPHRDLGNYKYFDVHKDSVCYKDMEMSGGVEGSLSVPSEGNEPGYYDVVLAVDGVLIAYTVVRLYPEGELSRLSDAELEALSAKK
jgi:hypothetical protein